MGHPSCLRGPMPKERQHGYLGTHLSPIEYYRRHAAAYDNPHADGIARALGHFAGRLEGVVLDWGCGDGLATKLLAAGQPDGQFVGVDNAPLMVARYIQETGFKAVVAGFGDALPRADSAVASYALHLASPAETAVMWWRLAESGVKTLVVVTPFKARPAAPAFYYAEAERVFGRWGPEGKTIYAVLYRRLEDDLAQG
jgi:SAM-dependent methyltransferase